jgi:hypothetical protein
MAPYLLGFLSHCWNKVQPEATEEYPPTHPKQLAISILAVFNDTREEAEIQ